MITPAHRTRVSIRGDAFWIDGRPTYEGRSWNGLPIEGLLMNARLVQGIFDDLNPDTRGMWKYPDTGSWDPDRNTDEFVAAMPGWRESGLLAFTINLQGGMPRTAREGDQPWHNSAITEAGGLRVEYMARLSRILDRAGELGMAVILGVFYFGQAQRIGGETAIRRAVDETVDWIFSRGYEHVLLEINNECNVRYTHPVLQPPRVHELVSQAQARSHGGRRLLVSTSYGGGTIPDESVARVADFLLLHGNGVDDPGRIAAMVRETRQVPGYRGVPVLFNEDDHYGFDAPANNCLAAVGERASWGYYDQGRNDYGEGFQSPPVRWDPATSRKRGFFGLMRTITGR
ncbi:MAG: hypothetical protein AAB152_03100 [Candidatus Coatesbacteria bacterium]